ncbi:GIY-YIG nuclease family protein [Massilia sp. CF038]|uniref:GIY-YIG nuclease family protein n=1 Tax=Massilia sp. CF038 TaxID=1881045 RepID=UPI0009150D12|nr:GIY-YIG nuclease family protein [Massilia sp. CF038]SHG35447.1 putative endonuclease [Massilia sp. CF038]
MDQPSYVYIMASKPYGTLYTGVSTDLVRRVWEHREEFLECFTSTYHVHRLVWYEIHGDVMEAVAREKRIKKFKRAWKISLISKSNPTWRDLYADFTA